MMKFSGKITEIFESVDAQPRAFSWLITEFVGVGFTLDSSSFCGCNDDDVKLHFGWCVHGDKILNVFSLLIASQIR